MTTTKKNFEVKLNRAWGERPLIFSNENERSFFHEKGGSRMEEIKMLKLKKLQEMKIQNSTGRKSYGTGTRDCPC